MIRTTKNTTDKTTTTNRNKDIINQRVEAQNGDLTGSTRVLIIDDEETFLELTRAFLTKLSGGTLQIDCISHAYQASAQLKEKIYDVIVSDYQMPGTDGIQLLEYVRSAGITIPFIMFTGRGREEVAIKALNLGADRYIKKGGDPKSQFEELAHAIKELVHAKFVEQALEESEREKEAILDSISDFIVYF